MNILTSAQFSEWDSVTSKNQGIGFYELMERAANACKEYIQRIGAEKDILIFCGPGNNGGDGYALARLLHELSYNVLVVEVAEPNNSFSPDNRLNQKKLIPVVKMISFEEFQRKSEQSHYPVVVDALFGIGQNRPLSGIYKKAAEWINDHGKMVFSIDMPTGLFEVCHDPQNTAVKASVTLTFGALKLPFFFPENERYLGEVEILDIGLDKNFPHEASGQFHYLTENEIRNSALQRKKFSHKGTYGTAYLFAGQLGMAGAAILASKACLRSGVGKLIVRTPKDCLNILQSNVPEAICEPDANDEVLSTFPTDLTRYQSVGIGPGIGKSPLTKALVWKLLGNGVPNLVMDADALNIIAEEGWQNRIPPGAVITPHIKELERLWGSSENHFERLKMAISKAMELKIVIVVKGAHTAIISPTGAVYFNTTGNSGLAKAGTGDVLTGMIIGILAQGYQVTEGVKRAVYLHGKTADILSQHREPESILASDLVNSIGISKL